MSIRFSILITTKNRCNELLHTLTKLSALLNRTDVECIVCDDGSTDDTLTFLKQYSPTLTIIHHPKSIGLIGSRNELMAMARGIYAISLDDDAHFLSDHPLEHIEQTFLSMPDCAVIAFRIYWGLVPPAQTETTEKPARVQSFVGCGHAWKMEAWRAIPDYPAWFIFYGEEDFASYHLFKQHWQVQYVPSILIQHRVHVTARKQQSDYRLRLRRSLRAGWILMLLFFPWKTIPRRWGYSVATQINKRTFNGDFRGTVAILQALADVLIRLPRIFNQMSKLTIVQFEDYQTLKETPIYWSPTQ